MAASEYPDAPPPEVPEEFADAYRAAYERALRAGSGADAALPEVPPQEVVRVGVHSAAAEGGSEGDEPAGVLARWRGTRWFPPALFGAVALVLVVGAYAIGSALSDDPPGSAQSDGAQRSTAPMRTTPPATPTAAPSRAPGGWKGPVVPTSIGAIGADCTARPSHDAAGHPVRYAPENAIDRKDETAWRCPGTAVGQKLVLRLGGDVDVAQVGLIPGYAKRDPASGVDRYAENNRITRVRWMLGDGVTVVQRLDPDPSTRSIQLLRVPRTTAATVTLEILGVHRGPRNTTAISTLAVWAAG